MNKVAPIRILIIDDNPSIHEDFVKILQPPLNTQLSALDGALFAETSPSIPSHTYLIDSASQGEEGIAMVKKALESSEPYTVIFVDVRMPPGIDGVETVKEILKIDAEVQVVICTAYSDYSWEGISANLLGTDRLLILKKPFDVLEIRQIVETLSRKYALAQENKLQMSHLEQLVQDRTNQLEKSNQRLAESFSLIKAILESTQEGLIALTQNKKIIAYNQKFLSLWNTSAEQTASLNGTRLFQQLALQVEEPHLFLITIFNLCKNPKKDHIQEVLLKSKRVFELYANPRYLHDKVAGVVLSFREISDRKQLECQLLNQATCDGLTGLPNRLLLMDRIQQNMVNAKRNLQYMAILMINLDHFEQINESLGYEVGDRLLQLVAKRLQGALTEADTLARIASDEFVILIATIHHHAALSKRAETVLATFKEPFIVKDKNIFITACMGGSVFPTQGKDAEELLSNAASALHHAKSIGENQFKTFSPDYSQSAIKRRELKIGLELAFDRQEFKLCYHPFVDLSSKRVIGFEALLRWKHPTLGDIPPNDFIPIAEETGLMVQIGEWVLRNACLQTAAWHSINPSLSLAVNIAESQFMHDNFIMTVMKVLEETHFPPQCLEFDITENIIVENSAYVLRKMRQLKTMGIKLTMDDFGSGSASFSYVKYFPFDKIKIDKSLIDGINRNIDDNNFIETIINMSKPSKLQVVAEGVETQEQIDFLKKHQSDQIQGYYFSLPLSVEQCTDFIKKHVPFSNNEEAS